MSNEIIVTSLPPQQQPKQLTAHYTIKTLGEHAMAFLNANNKTSWAEDNPEEADNLSTYLGSLLNQKEHTLEDLKKVCYVLRQGPTKSLKMHRTYDLLGRLLGYESWQDAIANKTEQESIINKNFGNSFNDVSAKHASEGAPHPVIFERSPKRLEYHCGYKLFRKQLRPAMSNNMFKQGFRDKLHEMIKLLDPEPLENFDGIGVQFSLFKDHNNDNLFWLVAQLPLCRVVPFKDYKTYRAPVELYPFSKMIKSIGDVELSDKSYAQYRFENKPE